MDLYKTIRDLYEEMKQLERVIALLEAELAAGLPKRRGRPNMDAAAREEVSLRMKEYWAKRRAAG